MRIIIPRVILATITLLIAADASQSAVFSRLHQRRKDEIRAEVSAELSEKLERDLSREVEILEQALHDVTVSQVEDEARKLETQVAQAIMRLRRQAAKLVAKESKRLGREATDNISALHADAQADLAATTQTLENHIQDQSALLRDETNRVLRAESAMLRDLSQRELQSLTKLLTSHVENKTRELHKNNDLWLEQIDADAHAAISKELQILTKTLASHVEDKTRELHKSNDLWLEQISNDTHAAISEELASIPEEVARLRQQAAELVAYESERLEAETAEVIRTLRSDTRSDLLAMTQQLNKQFQVQSVLLRDETDRVVKAETERLHVLSRKDLQFASKQLQKIVGELVLTMKDAITTDLTATIRTTIATEIQAIRVASRFAPQEASPAENVSAESQLPTTDSDSETVSENAVE